MAPVKDETGKRYGKLLVIRKRLDVEQQPNRAYWICRCDCGNEKAVSGDKLRGGTFSCGCHTLKLPTTWRSDARKLRARGMNNGQISRALSVNLGTIRRFFDMDLGENQIVMTGGSTGYPDSVFVRPHVYRTPRRIEMGPIVAAALAALEARQ
jgi:hypothetical protein